MLCRKSCSCDRFSDYSSCRRRLLRTRDPSSKFDSLETLAVSKNCHSWGLMAGKRENSLTSSMVSIIEVSALISGFSCRILAPANIILSVFSEICEELKFVYFLFCAIYYDKRSSSLSRRFDWPGARWQRFCAAVRIVLTNGFHLSGFACDQELHDLPFRRNFL